MVTIRMNRSGASPDAFGIFLGASGVIAEGNVVEDAKTWGIFVDDRYERIGNEAFIMNYDPRIFCRNTIRRAGTPGRNDTGAIVLFGSGDQFLGNHVEASPSQPTPQGGTVVSGRCNLFRENTFSDVTNCGNPYIGCVVCGATSGCQRFSGNTGGSSITTCASCP